MRRVLLSQIEPGMVLARSVFDERGDALLVAGMELTPKLCGALERRGIMSLLISDELSEGIVIHEVVSERVRSVTIGRLHTSFESLSRAAVDFRGGDRATVAEGIRSPRFASAIGGTKIFDQLWSVVKDIVSDVLAAEDMASLTDIQSHDDYTFGHAVDMAATAVLLGRLIHLDRQSLRRVAMGSLLHDVGEVFVDEALLNKPGKLSPEEWATLQQHTTWGYELMKSEGWGDVLTRLMVYQHHERQDGTGYPRGLVGANRIFRTTREGLDGKRITLLAEVAAVADVYDALSSDRPYRPALSHERTIATMRELASSHLNQELVTYFLNVTPVFPVGTEVRLTSGPLTGCTALVVRTPEEALDRPLVRVFLDAAGARVEPFDIDLTVEPEMGLTATEALRPAA